MKKYFTLLDASLSVDVTSNMNNDLEVKQGEIIKTSVATVDDILDEVFDSFVSKNFGDEAKARLPARKWIKINQSYG